MTLDSTTLIIVVAIAVAIVAVLAKSTKFSFKRGDTVAQMETTGKDNVVVQKIKNDSDIDVKNRDGQNVTVQEIDKSKVKIH